MQVVSEIDHLLSKQAMNLKNEEAASLRRFKQKLTDVSVLWGKGLGGGSL